MEIKIDDSLKADSEELRRLAAKGKLKKYVGKHYGMTGRLVRTFKKLGKGRIEVTPYFPEEKRFSWITSDPLISELEPVSPEDIK